MASTLWWLAALGVANVVMLAVLAWRVVVAGREPAASREDLFAQTRLQAEALSRLERELRDELSRSAQGTRQELGGTLALFQQTLLTQQGDVARTQNEQLDGFRAQLVTLQQLVADTLRSTAAALTSQAQSAREAQDLALRRFAEGLNEQLRALSEANERRLAEVRQTVESRLAALAADNEKKLEQMRQTVDEKLHATLEQRLGQSFKQVAERLEQVHRGLGEMQSLAQGVGDLKRVLTNVKTRGVFGETQLAVLLEQVFTPDQYETHVATVPGSRERVEFAIRLPGKGEDGAPVWLPLDAKFPREDYERLLAAQDEADREAAEAAAKALEQRIREEARSIAAKYLAPPHTTDFGVLFVPTEGLYAELLRRPGLVEALQREHRVILAGPTTLLAMLNSLQMGFRTLALEKRSSEVWKVLGAVKTEFGKFGEVLARVRDQTQTVLNTLDKAETRTRQMSRALRTVEALPEAQAAGVLPQDALDDRD
ncbi:MAG: DNA recombination protein RmuC [Caldimonas manganoxidans]|nr:DNA recombination protein RmuC [Caldimonas manganoxidans]